MGRVQCRQSRKSRESSNLNTLTELMMRPPRIEKTSGHLGLHQQGVWAVSQGTAVLSSSALPWVSGARPGFRSLWLAEVPSGSAWKTAGKARHGSGVTVSGWRCPHCPPLSPR
jgi:hypothetical protein